MKAKCFLKVTICNTSTMYNVTLVHMGLAPCSSSHVQIFPSTCHVPKPLAGHQRPINNFRSQWSELIGGCDSFYMIIGWVYIKEEVYMFNVIIAYSKYCIQKKYHSVFTEMERYQLNTPVCIQLKLIFFNVYIWKPVLKIKTKFIKK